MKAPDGWPAIVAYYSLPERGPDGLVLPSWIATNLVTLLAPFPLQLAWGGTVTHITCHRKIGGLLIETLDAVKTAGLDGLLAHDYGGCYCDRAIRGEPQHLSLHALGAAIDVRTRLNPMGTDGEPGMAHLIVPIFAHFNWTWGGHFARKDPMHFQFGTGA